MSQGLFRQGGPSDRFVCVCMDVRRVQITGDAVVTGGAAPAER